MLPSRIASSSSILSFRTSQFGRLTRSSLRTGPPAHDRRLAVVQPVRVRARVVDVVRVLPLGGAAGAEVAVAGGGQCLAQSLVGGIEVVVAQRASHPRRRTLAHRRCGDVARACRAGARLHRNATRPAPGAGRSACVVASAARYEVFFAGRLASKAAFTASVLRPSSLATAAYIAVSRASCSALCAASILSNAALTVAWSMFRPVASAAMSFEWSGFGGRAPLRLAAGGRLRRAVGVEDLLDVRDVDVQRRGERRRHLGAAIGSRPGRLGRPRCVERGLQLRARDAERLGDRGELRGGHRAARALAAWHEPCSTCWSSSRSWRPGRR